MKVHFLSGSQSSSSSNPVLELSTLGLLLLLLLLDAVGDFLFSWRLSSYNPYLPTLSPILISCPHTPEDTLGEHSHHHHHHHHHHRHHHRHRRRHHRHHHHHHRRHHRRHRKKCNPRLRRNCISFAANKDKLTPWGRAAKSLDRLAISATRWKCIAL